jgi:kinesin family protein 2/24
MPEEEFKQRCIKTEEVSREQVGAFYSRFWQKHVDASNYTNGSKSKGDEFDQYKESSAVPKDVAKVPFKQRIRPGMVVKYKPSKPTGLDFNMATILCPDWAVETHVKDWQGNEVVVATGGPKRYLCGLVSPGLLPDSYQVSIWRQAVIAVEDMEAEVTLEYDQAMRYYFIDV